MLLGADANILHPELKAIGAMENIEISQFVNKMNIKVSSKFGPHDELRTPEVVDFCCLHHRSGKSSSNLLIQL